MKRKITMILTLVLMLTVVTAFAADGSSVRVSLIRRADHFGDQTILKAFLSDNDVAANARWYVCEKYVEGAREWKYAGHGPCLYVELTEDAVKCGYRCRVPNGPTSAVFVFRNVTYAREEAETAAENIEMENAVQDASAQGELDLPETPEDMNMESAETNPEMMESKNEEELFGFEKTPEDLNAEIIAADGVSMRLKPLDGSNELIRIEKNTVVHVLSLSKEWAQIGIDMEDEERTGYVRKKTIKLLPNAEPLVAPRTWVEAEAKDQQAGDAVDEGTTLYLCVDPGVYEDLVRIQWQCDYGIRDKWQDIPEAGAKRYPILLNPQTITYLYRVELVIDE